MEGKGRLIHGYRLVCGQLLRCQYLQLIYSTFGWARVKNALAKAFASSDRLIKHSLVL